MTTNLFKSIQTPCTGSDGKLQSCAKINEAIHDWPAAVDDQTFGGDSAGIPCRLGSRAAVAATLAARPVYLRELPTYRVVQLVSCQFLPHAAPHYTVCETGVANTGGPELKKVPAEVGVDKPPPLAGLIKSAHALAVARGLLIWAPKSIIDCPRTQKIKALKE
jgi:hypothetical protein